MIGPMDGDVNDAGIAPGEINLRRHHKSLTNLFCLSWVCFMSLVWRNFAPFASLWRYGPRNIGTAFSISLWLISSFPPSFAQVITSTLQHSMFWSFCVMYFLEKNQKYDNTQDSYDKAFNLFRGGTVLVLHQSIALISCMLAYRAYNVTVMLGYVFYHYEQTFSRNKSAIELLILTSSFAVLFSS